MGYVFICPRLPVCFFHAIRTNQVQVDRLLDLVYPNHVRSVTLVSGVETSSTSSPNDRVKGQRDRYR
jgi:hypothetical protein